MYISSLMNLYNNIKHDCFLCSSSDGHFNVSSIFVILSLQFLLQVCLRHATLYCSILNLCIKFCWCGSQIEEQYSIDGKQFVYKRVPVDVVGSNEV